MIQIFIIYSYDSNICNLLYEGNPQFIIKIVYSCVFDLKIITPKYFRLLFFRHHQGRMIVKNSTREKKISYKKNKIKKFLSFRIFFTIILP